MDESHLSKTPSELQGTYLKRRLTLFGAIVALLVLLTLVVVLTSEQRPPPVLQNLTVETPEPVPSYEPEPVAENNTPAEVIDETNEIEECEVEAPLDYLGCLEPNEGPNIFGAYGLNFDDRSVKRLIEKVEEACDIDEDSDEPVDRQCVLNAAVSKSENSWVCKWDCLKDLASCETYKMHLAVAILRKYIPPTDVFVARTPNFNFFLIYKDNDGEWIQPQYTFISNPVAEAIYNDVYHAGPITEVVYPEITEVEPGDEFCFDVTAPRSCVCSIEVTSFIVGDCPQLPADLRGICETSPKSDVYLMKGSNEICFTVSDDAEDEFYTYNFELTSGEDFVPAGNAFIKQKKWDCCVNASFKGFLSIT